MGAVDTVAPESLSSTTSVKWRRDRRFFTGMAIAAAVAVFIGFYPTYYLKLWWGTPVLPLIFHVHGVAFTSWIVLLVAQTWLVAVHRIDVHRRLGVAGAILAGLMTVVGLAAAVFALQHDRMSASFFAVPMGTVVAFPPLVGAALMMRRKAEAHKRLMWVATTEILNAPVGRWPVIWRSSAFVAYSVTDLFLAALLIYDLVRLRRFHPATVWGGLFLIGSQILRTVIQHTNVWLAFATWIKG